MRGGGRCHRSHLRSARWGLVLLGVLGLAAASTARAQSDQALPPDIVRTVDGAFYRGTILELVPESHVIILSVTGEHVRLEMDRVAYCGRASDEEHPDARSMETNARPPPDPIPAQPDVRVRVESAQSGLELHRLAYPEATVDIEVDETDDEDDEDDEDEDESLELGAYVPVCAIPCNTELPAGDLDLAVSRDGGSPVETDGPIRLEPGEALLGVSYEDHRRTRTAGLAIFCTGLAAAAGMMLGGTLGNRDIDSQMSPVVWAGVAVAGVSIFTGVLLRARGDDTSIEVSPLPAEP